MIDAGAQAYLINTAEMVGQTDFLKDTRTIISQNLTAP